MPLNPETIQEIQQIQSTLAQQKSLSSTKSSWPRPNRESFSREYNRLLKLSKEGRVSLHNSLRHHDGIVSHMRILLHGELTMRDIDLTRDEFVNVKYTFEQIHNMLDILKKYFSPKKYSKKFDAFEEDLSGILKILAKLEERDQPTMLTTFEHNRPESHTQNVSNCDMTSGYKQATTIHSGASSLFPLVTFRIPQSPNPKNSTPKDPNTSGLKETRRLNQLHNH